MRYLSIDQGGTKTHALVCDERGYILGNGKAAGACFSASGVHQAIGACEAALKDAGFNWRDIDRVCAGMTGIDWPEDAPFIRDKLREYTGIKDIQTVNDCVTAYWAGTDSQNGVCVCSGTGTNVCCVKEGNEPFCLGYYVNVPHLGRRALEAAIDAFTGVGENTALTLVVLEHYNCGSMDALIKALNNGSVSLRSAKYLVPRVVETAKSDKVSRMLCVQFAYRCADYAVAMMRQANLPHNSAVLASGGVFRDETGLLFSLFSRRVRESFPEANVINARYEPVMGGMRLLLKPEAYKTLEEEALKYGLVR